MVNEALLKRKRDDLAVALGIGIVVVRDVLSVGVHPEDQPRALLRRELHATVTATVRTIRFMC